MSTEPNPKPTLRLGTRGSQLAMWQSNWVKSELEKNGVAVELIRIRTEGDIRTGSLAQIGGQGLFTKRLQISLVENEIDLAVHSLKDLPTEDHPELKIAAVPKRETTADALVSNHYTAVASLPPNAVVGTGSVRRAAQLTHLRSDLDVRDIRGNVDTRLQKLDNGEFDAIVLACAGLYRLGLQHRIAHAFSPDEMMPAVGQGALGLETRSGDLNVINLVARLNDPISFHRALAERSMLRSVFAGCVSPVAAATSVDNDQLTLDGIVLSRDGQQKIHASQSLELTRSSELGEKVAAQLIDAGADKFLNG